MFSEEDAEYAEALRMGPICTIVLDGDPKEPHIGMVIYMNKVLMESRYTESNTPDLQTNILWCNYYFFVIVR